MNSLWTAGTVAVLLVGLAVAGLTRRDWFPESLNLPLKVSLRLNLWALVAVVVSFAARWCLRQPGWSDAGRAGVALLPLAPAVLYGRDILRWVRGLDELQRRIQIEAVLIVALVMGLAMLGVDLLQAAGFMGGFHWGFEFAYAVTFLLWTAGCAVAARRYS